MMIVPTDPSGGNLAAPKNQEWHDLEPRRQKEREAKAKRRPPLFCTPGPKDRGGPDGPLAWLKRQPLTLASDRRGGGWGDGFELPRQIYAALREIFCLDCFAATDLLKRWAGWCDPPWPPVSEHGVARDAMDACAKAAEKDVVDTLDLLDGFDAWGAASGESWLVP